MSALRRYAVHACEEGRARACSVEAVSFEDAAVAFLELWPALDGDAVRLIVTDCETGRECCVSVDMGAGEAEMRLDWAA